MEQRLEYYIFLPYYGWNITVVDHISSLTIFDFLKSVLLIAREHKDFICKVKNK